MHPAATSAEYLETPLVRKIQQVVSKREEAPTKWEDGGIRGFVTRTRPDGNCSPVVPNLLGETHFGEGKTKCEDGY
jgi:hypothetical protein